MKRKNRVSPKAAALPLLNRRGFAFGAAAFSSAALLAGCHSGSKPSRDATLLHNRAVREAVADLDRAMNSLEERSGQFTAENWQDALANLQISLTRMRGSIDEVKTSLGYSEG